ncbi:MULTISPECIES: sigma-54 dependent transcriptional regulator [unclassified Variovorax]|uniref:sigma-54-dependent transcriptional regulator n=1 Tax=unclassified Variovorax TaxID=663243 RepID=UPI00076DB739|nr:MULTISPECIES: sigma-54 dependent transcriptional regulator [unclassified Variovorax]KWT96980.1 two component, sigma54 specific, transcriptional regulator, Fis family [Variovorax sp. WDL1]PNG58537.1 Regulatory protein LuxO [Variovorax sp. B4]PNG61673.1 Regulatory protein LuxO [Variovorax sp. B2]VTV12281.1 Regulatory protein LuxO [Variovorax sp. WDL1]
MGHALIVEDDEDSARMLAALVKREGHSVATAMTLGHARRYLAMQQPDLLLLDLHLPDGNGLDLFEDTGLLTDTEVVLMTGQASLETSIRALRLGAADYLVKPVNPQHLKGLLSRLIRPSKLRAELAEIAEHWRETGRFGPLIGASEAMQGIYRQIARVAETAVSVFIHGESGTGKELVAKAVHDLSRRREQPFLAVNCGAISPHLIESEIFGHERGSFTGAERQHQGFFERAHGGTLFLDEVTEMPLNLQVKLLRVLENGTFMRVGSTQLQQTDVRIIAATNRDAAEAVMRGGLREDLLYRLNVFPIPLPPLRERADDIPLLARSFLDDLQRQEQATKRFTPEAMERLKAYPWPGNVRELRNAVQRAWVMAAGAEIDDEWLPKLPGPEAPRPLQRAGAARPLPEQSPAGHRELSIRVGTPLAEVERQLILATFEYCGQHKERTAALLGISMKTLYNRLKEYRL